MKIEEGRILRNTYEKELLRCAVAPFSVGDAQCLSQADHLIK